MRFPGHLFGIAPFHLEKGRQFPSTIEMPSLIEVEDFRAV